MSRLSERVTCERRCDACGRFISYEDLQEGYAVRRLRYPDGHFPTEEYETLCAKRK